MAQWKGQMLIRTNGNLKHSHEVKSKVNQAAPGMPQNEIKNILEIDIAYSKHQVPRPFLDCALFYF